MLCAIVEGNIYTLTYRSSKGLVQEGCVLKMPASGVFKFVNQNRLVGGIWPNVGMCKSRILLTELHFCGAKRIGAVGETKMSSDVGNLFQTTER